MVAGHAKVRQDEARMKTDENRVQENSTHRLMCKSKRPQFAAGVLTQSAQYGSDDLIDFRVFAFNLKDDCLWF